MIIFKKVIFLVVCLLLLTPASILADGMIIPPPDKWIQETEQKAVIFHDEGVETLVISITFQGDANDFGWVIPVPARPDVSKGSDELFTSLEVLTGYSYSYNEKYIGLGVSGIREADEVTIIETKKIDYYDVTVLSSTNEDALVDWLNDNGYDFPSSASYILDSYIENEWYFVAMRINPKSLGWSNVSEQLRTGHATPVVISFETDKIVYPLKISSVVSQQIDTVPRVQTEYLNTGYIEQTNAPVLHVTYLDKAGKETTVDLADISDSIVTTYHDNNYGKFDLCDIGRNANGDTHACLLKFDISELPKTATITESEIELYAQTTPNNLTIQTHRILQEWREGKSGEGSGERNSPEIDGVTANERYYGAEWNEQFIGTDDIDATSVSYGEFTTHGESGKHTVAVEPELVTGWLQGTFPNYGVVLKAITGSGTAAFLSRDPKDASWHLEYSNSFSSYADILLYVIADEKKSLPDFSTSFANTIDKESIKQLALNDQGDPLLQPEQKKYFLTKLYRNMRYADMSEDLYLRDASDSTTIGDPIATSSNNSTSPFTIVIIASVVLSIGLAFTIMYISRRLPSQ